MPHFSTFPASTRHTTLDDVLEMLRDSPRVRACLMLGSTAEGVSPWSDYDLLLVGDFRESFAIEFSIIDGRASDLILISDGEFERLLSQDRPSAPGDCDALSWIAKSRVAIWKLAAAEPDPRATAARILKQASVLDEEAFCRWVEANHTILKVRRYQASTDEEYRDGLELLVTKALAELPQDFLSARGIRWLGDKDAMKNVRSVQSEFADSVLEALRVELLSDKCDRYQELARHAFKPVGGLWADGETAGGWFRFSGTPEERSAWERLLAN